jgi:membrane-associated protein
MDTLLQWISWFIDFVLHMDKHLPQMVNDFGLWAYVVLFIIIFIETGLVVTPFLPGDSLLFAAGAVAATTHLDPLPMFLLLAFAAILGDTVNYWIGHYLGPKMFTTNSRWFKRAYLERTHAFYEKHGGKTILLARFIPIIRTFAPFVAGIGRMNYGYFLTYNVIGGILWTALFIATGYFFGNLEFVKENFSLVILAIIFISFLPPMVEFLREKFKPKQPAAE